MLNKFKNRKTLLLMLILTSITLSAWAELRDPTKPEGFTFSKKKVNVDLTAIFISDQDDNKFAVIDGRILHVGDFYADLEVMSIEPNKVMLKGPDGYINLSILNIPIKQAR